MKACTPIACGFLRLLAVSLPPLFLGMPLSAGDSDKVMVLKAPSFTLQQKYGPNEAYIAFSPDGKSIVTTGALAPLENTENARVWNAATGKEIHTLKIDGERIVAGNSLAFNPKTSEL